MWVLIVVFFGNYLYYGYIIFIKMSSVNIFVVIGKLNGRYYVYTYYFCKVNRLILLICNNDGRIY